MRETLRVLKEYQERKKGIKIINFHALTDHMNLNFGGNGGSRTHLSTTLSIFITLKAP